MATLAPSSSSSLETLLHARRLVMQRRPIHEVSGSYVGGVSQVFVPKAEEMLNAMVPAGFTHGIEPHRDFAVVRGLPTIPDDNTLYLVRPSELASANLWGNALSHRRLAKVRDLWRAGTRLSPIELHWLPDQRLVLDEGNHRVQVAAQADQMLAAKVFRASRWTPPSALEPIAQRVRDALPASVGTPAAKDTAPSGFVQNPQRWVTDIIAASWDLMSDSVQAAWLPKLSDVSLVKDDQIAARVDEYGCGKFGCVFPTSDPAVVMKVTSDESEANFAAHLSTTLVAPICVDYYMVIAIANRTHQNRRLFLLWRENANSVGEVDTILGQAAENMIAAQHHAAQRAFLALAGREIPGESGRPNDVARRLLAKWAESCEAMARQTKVPELRALGDGLVECWGQQRLFFGDIHGGNLGIVHRSDGGHWVVTDPGYASIIDYL